MSYQPSHRAGSLSRQSGDQVARRSITQLHVTRQTDSRLVDLAFKGHPPRVEVTVAAPAIQAGWPLEPKWNKKEHEAAEVCRLTIVNPLNPAAPDVPDDEDDDNRAKLAAEEKLRLDLGEHSKGVAMQLALGKKLLTVLWVIAGLLVLL